MHSNTASTFQNELIHSLKRNCDRIAIEFEDQSILYSELLNASNKITSFLLHKNIEAETLIGIKLEKKTDIIFSIIGVCNARCVFVPLDSSLPESRLSDMIDNLDLKYVISSKSFTNKGMKDYSSSYMNYFLEDILENNSDGLSNLEYPQYDQNDSLYVYFTSGSTGTPKGIVGKNISLLQFLQWEIKEFDIDMHTRFSQFISPYFDAFLRDVFTPLMTGGTICIPPDELIVPWIDKAKINLIHCVPSLFSIINHQDISFSDYKYLKLVLMSGEKVIPSELINWYKIFDSRIGLVNFYGTTETTMIRAFYRIRPEDVNLSRIPIGYPIDDTELLVANKDFKACGKLIAGELYIISKYVSKGYLNLPELTSEKFLKINDDISEGKIAFRTGDQARVLANGAIDLIGREDRQIKLRGIRIELGEVETILLKSNLLKNAIVMKNTDDSESLIAFVIRKEGLNDNSSQINDLQQYLENHLPKYMIPSNITELKEYPLLGNGKINYKGLISSLNFEKEIINPINPIEHQLLLIWKTILGEKPISTDQTFSRAGGNSLSMMSLISRIDREFNVKFSLSKLFDNLTIKKQADFIRNTNKDTISIIPKSETKEHYTLSAAQKRLYFLYEFDKNSIGYNMPSTVRFEGELDRTQLGEAFTKLMARHESLRTYFEILDEMPVQKIAEISEFAIQYFTANEKEAKFIVDDFVKPFNLNTGPLVRVGLISVEPTNHILIFDIHHIISDGTSHGILINDFMALYHQKSLPSLKLQFKDFSEWQQGDEQQMVIGLKRQFWANEFFEKPKNLELPIDFLRPDIKVYQGGFLNFELDDKETSALRSIAESKEVTMFMVILSIYYIFLSKVSHQEDIVIGTPVEGRHFNDLENVIGMFVNTLPLRNYPRSNLSVKDFLLQVKLNVLSSLNNQDFPYEELIEALGVNRDTSRNPLFDVMLAYQNFKTAKPEMSGLVLSSFLREQRESKFDITLFVFEREDKITINFEYATSLFKKETVGKFIEYFKNIVKAVISDINTKIQSIEIISDMDRNLVLNNFVKSEKADFNVYPIIIDLPFVDPVNDVPKHNSLIRILDRNMNLQPIGIVGELYISEEFLLGPYKRNKLIKGDKFLVDPISQVTWLYKTGLKAKWSIDGGIQLLRDGSIEKDAVWDFCTEEKKDFDFITGHEQAKLIEIWSDVLKVDRAKININSNFFELGGHSLKTLLLINKIFREFEVKVPLKVVFECKNLLSLGEFIKVSKKSQYLPIEPAKSQVHYPLSDAQRGMYFLYEFDKSSLFYNKIRVIKLNGVLDKLKLNSAFKKIISRHEIFRTSFHIIDDEPIQRISDDFNFELNIISASEAELKSIIKKMIVPFNLSKDCLLQATLIELNPLLNYLIINTHHIAVDGTSEGILSSELVSIYNDENLPDLKIQYKDYATWQQSEERQEKLLKQRKFWIDQFSDEAVPLELPADFLELGSETDHGGAVDFSLSNLENSQLKSISESSGTSMFMVILAVYNIFLSKIANQEDITVGTLVSGREHADVETMLGMFVSALPLRNYPRGILTFNEFLDEIKSNTLSCFENQAYQYKSHTHELNISRKNSFSGPYNVFLIYQNFEKNSHHGVKSLNIEEYDLSEIGESRYDINLVVKENGNNISISFNCSKLFKMQTINRFVDYFRQIVSSVIADTNVHLSKIQLLSELERNQILYKYNNTRKEINSMESFLDIFEEQVQRNPLNIAVEHNGTKLSYKDLYEKSRELSSTIKSRGIKRNSRIAVLMPRGVETLISILAIFQAGSIYVPLDIDYPIERIKEILSNSESPILLSTVEAINDMNKLSTPLDLGGLILVDQTSLTAYDPITKNEFFNSQDLAYIIYTSGTTGKPKGVMIHHLGMLNHLFAKITDLSLCSEDIIAQTASPCFDISIWQFLAALMVGGKTFIIDKEDIIEPKRLVNCLAQGEVTVFESVPSLMNTFLDGLPTDDNDNLLIHLRWMIPTGEPLNTRLVKKWHQHFPNIKLLNAYGPTEASDDVTHYLVDPVKDTGVIPIGRPIQNTHVYILDKYLNLCPVGVKGEIYIAGLCVGKGYWRDEQKTEHSFIQSPFANESGFSDYKTIYRTGDIGYFLETGNIVCMGRVDEQIKIRGSRIEVLEIEKFLLEDERIMGAVVTTFDSSDGDKKLVAFVASTDLSINIADLKTKLKAKLPHYMIPSALIKIDEIPITNNGKVDKKALLSKIDISSLSGLNYIPPKTAIEKEVSTIWMEILGIDNVGLNDTFFDLGGHSLLLIRNNQKIKNKFKVELPFKIFFEKTLQEIADVIANHLSSKNSALPCEVAD